MRYLNCNQVLPPELIAQIQEYVDGAYLYIPRKPEGRRAWGEVSRQPSAVSRQPSGALR